MSLYRNTFPKKHNFLPVVHVEEKEQALRNALIAQKEGADGMFMISHTLNHKLLLEFYQYVKNQLPDFWIGVNCLDLGSSIVHTIPKTCQGIWVDYAGIKEGDNATFLAEEFAKTREQSGWQGIYFGGVAFKYQTKIRDPARVAKLAKPLVDVITTSGEETGKAADVDKIRVMKEAIGDHPLAIASGITAENIREYIPHVDCFLVATGISDSFADLNPRKVRAIAQKLRD